jgi:hypothetical protein
MATTPTIEPSNANSSSVTGPNLVPHQHNFDSIIGLRFGGNGRVEPVYDSGNVYVNGVVVALYNAATTEGSFTAPTVPKVTVTSAVQNVEGDDDNTAGKAEADRFLAEGRITKAEYDTITTTPKPAGEGVKPGAVIAGKDSTAVTGDLSYATVLTPKGTTLGTMIKNVTFPRTIQQLADCHPSVTSPQNVVNNLAALALNVYEPVKAKYPNAFMTNSFRHGASIGGGAHGTGQACDIQFRGVAAHDYYDIAVWMSKNIAYDQLLLEYLPGKTVWIHVSYAIPGLPYGGISTRKTKGVGSTLATLNGAAGGKFTPNLHADIIQAALPNKIVAA